MKVYIIAGTPGAGKTSVVVNALSVLIKENVKCVAAKIDCLYTDDDIAYEKAGIPVKVGISKDMCPDHFLIYNLDEIIKWAKVLQADYLFVETAGLCHRCAPYINNSLGICVIDATTGPNTPFKLGPFLSTADVAVITKGDLISQAEREIFCHRISEINKKAYIIEANGLNGKGSIEFIQVVKTFHPEADLVNKLRHSAPIAICTLCAGEERVNKNIHYGVLRNIDGLESYRGE